MLGKQVASSRLRNKERAHPNTSRDRYDPELPVNSK